MKNIMIIQKQPEIKDRELIRRELRREGYFVKTVDFESIAFSTADFSGVDLAVVHLYPDISASWQACNVLKHHIPDLPIFIHMRRHGINTLKSALLSIFL